MELYLKTKDHSVSQEAFSLYWNKEMDMLITQPCPTDLDPYYQSGDYISHTDGNASLFERIYQAVKRINVRKKLQYIDNQTNKPKTLLDIGAGTGDFLQLARSKGFEVQGMEPNAKARGLAVRKGIELVPDWEGLSKRKYQYITLWHVLEHLPDLEKRIKEMTALLEKDGSLVVAVPNFRSYDAKHYGPFWAGYDVPRHLWHFSKMAIARIFAAQGLEIVRTDPMWFDAFYVSLLSEKYKGSQWAPIKGFWFGLLSNLKALGSKEPSSLIYVLKRKN